MLQVSRENVLAHRAVVQGLNVPVVDATDSAVLQIGLQNTPPGSALIGLTIRAEQRPQAIAGLLTTDGPLALVMAARGVPHVVLRAELSLWAAALVPPDDHEAADVEEIADAMREIAGGGAISRPELSGALNGKVSEHLRAWCERCRSRHVREELFRKATLQAGFELDPDATAPVMFRPTGVRPSDGGRPELARAELFRRYIHLTGASRPSDIAAWLGYQPGVLRGTWDLIAHELTACDVDGTRRWALTSDVESLSNSSRPSGAKLLPPLDPYLLGDRFLVVPEREAQRHVWKAQVSPGTVLVNDEILGIWRQRVSGARLHIVLHPFRSLGEAALEGLGRDAEDIAALRGAREVALRVERR